MAISAARTPAGTARAAATAAASSASGVPAAARWASHAAAVASSASSSRLAQWCLTAWNVPTVRPNCSRCLT